MDGLVIASSTKNKKSLLKPKQCPNCDEPNKPESKFCSKCKFVMSFDAFSELEQEKTKAAEESENLKKRLEAVEQMLKRMFVYEYDIDIDLKNPDVLERETLEETLQRVNISNRRLE